MKDKSKHEAKPSEKEHEAKQNVNKHVVKRNKLQQQMSYGALFILAIVVVSFVAWPILSNSSASGDNVSLGSYRGKPINYAPEYGLFNSNLNYFLQQFGSQSINNPLQRRNLFERAFFSTINQYGHYFFLRDKGNDVSEKEVNSLIYKQFENAGQLDRVALSQLQSDPNGLRDRQNIMTYLAAQNIWNEIYESIDLVKNEAELELLVPTLGDMRRVSYLYYKLSDYPESELEKYYEQHKDLFSKKFLRRIAVDSEEDRSKVDAELESDPTRFGELAQLYSSDVYSQEQGDWGNKYYYELRDFFNSSEEASQWASEVYGLDKDAYAGPYQIGEQWFFFAIKAEEQNEDEANPFEPSVVRTYVERNEVAVITDYFRRNLESLKARASDTDLAYLGDANYASTPKFFGFAYTGEEGSSLYQPLSESFSEEGLATAIGQSKDFFEDIFALDIGQLSPVLLLDAPNTKYVAFFRLEEARDSRSSDFAEGGLESKKSLYNYYMNSLLTGGLQLEFLAQKNLKSRFEKAYDAWNARRPQN